MTKITIVVEYDEGIDAPGFTANMTAFGGRVIAVQFNDALLENEDLQMENIALSLANKHLREKTYGTR